MIAPEILKVVPVAANVPGLNEYLDRVMADAPPLTPVVQAQLALILHPAVLRATQRYEAAA